MKKIVMNTPNVSKVWDSARVALALKHIQEGEPLLNGSPFYEGDIELKTGELVFEYSKTELTEIAKCATDIVYFANTYCKSMTDDGIQQITLRPYQERVLRAYQDNRWLVFLSSRQSGKTVMTGIFITWFILFNIDKNVMILANKGQTAGEIVDKIKTVIRGLPFFLKPGIVQNNVMSMKFDNGCRIISSSTTKSAAIGFTIHLAFMDEFAHIHRNFIEPFYRSVFPTLSASKISRVIITSTPNGRNKFWEIYQGAVEGKNEYYPIRVDWWEVPDRDEAWKETEIANMGSEEAFNQEYGNQFLSADTLLLSGNALSFMKRISKKYVWREIEDYEENDLNYKLLKWHPDFDIDNIGEDDRFLFTIDLSDGIGRDFSVVNIFRIELMSKAGMRRLRKDRLKDESSFYRLRQVGMLRANNIGVDDFARLCEILFFNVFKPEKISIALEMNFKGDYFVERLRGNEEYFDEMFIHTRHNENAKYNALGIKLYTHNKMLFCRDLRKLINERRVILNEETTCNEMESFGINKKGSYSSQFGYDDTAITTIYTAPFLVSDDFSYVIEEIIDQEPMPDRELITELLSQIDAGEEFDMSFLKTIM